MLSISRKTIKTTRDSVEGTKEMAIEVDIGTNEPLDEVPERLGEVEDIVDDLLKSDEKFRALDIYQQAEYLELGLIFGTIPGTSGSQHFPRQCYLDLLMAKRDGRLESVKAVAVQAKADRLAAEKPVEPVVEVKDPK